jgi:hypothetical protein
MEPIDNQLSIPQKAVTEEVTAEPGVIHTEEPIEEGPYGALVLAGLAVCLLFIGWLLFYFVLFMRRGYVG